MSRRPSLTRRIQPALAVGEMAMPRWLMTRFPLVVSMERMACMPSSTCRRFMTPVSTGEPMKGTGWCGWVGDRGETCVVTITSPGSRSPAACMSASFRAVDRAATAPSASETSPIMVGRAPIAPSLPMTPSVPAVPPAFRPRFPGTSTRTKSVDPLAPVTRRTRTSSTPRCFRSVATASPVTCALSSSSMISRTCFKAIALLPAVGCFPDLATPSDQAIGTAPRSLPWVGRPGQSRSARAP